MIGGNGCGCVGGFLFFALLSALAHGDVLRPIQRITIGGAEQGGFEERAVDDNPQDADSNGEAIVLDFSQGSLIESGRSLDFALCGKGFFVIETPEGPLYTRNGMFRLNDNGHIVDSSGRIVAGDAGPITVPPQVGLSQISVSTDGNIMAAGNAIGMFKLVDFNENQGKLESVGINCYSVPENVVPAAAENLIVKQGFQESSNVQMVEELVDMMMVSNLYQANMKFISAGGEATQSLMSVAMA